MGRSEEAVAATERNAAMLRQVADLLRRHAEDAAAKTAQIAAGMGGAHESVRRQLEGLAATYKQAETGMEMLGEALARQTREVAVVTQQAVTDAGVWDEALRKRAQGLSATSDKVVGQARAVSKAMGRQTTDMRVAVREAAEVAASLKEQTEKTGIESFLRRATFISERLQSLAVDMSRLLETTVSEDDWRRFNKGEKGIFVRKMLGFREKAKLEAIKQKYQDDEEFRRYVTRYVSQFESLLKEAAKRDHDGILNATFMSSDMGKVYMILARALGREF